ncbi:hypothetical protein MW290_04975 [Aquincola tertiaricarbonis]|uniref:Uncharacterized protein n=1 Tax=Aquincola tertiaricarbonis TaxID=391953 RepID=A0ABY4S9K0_AQUTE|nr:DUF6544 family protein [Aquincola tertiaricarbonis]URI07940.1 hypothetical protein MW290_04975 [Aquincola tertiaricarbonis]
MVWIKWLVMVLAVLIVALGAFGASRWAANTRELTERLEASRAPIGPARYDAARELEGLPAPVQRFFLAVLKDGQHMVSAVTIEHCGTFNLAAEGPDQWEPFTSWQRSTMRRPGFVWDGRASMLPGVAVHVHDAYVAGEGILHPAVMGLVSLTELRGTSPEPDGVAVGEFMRWFAEGAWYPTALLPSQGVHWSEVDQHSALATASDGAVSVTLLFRFDPPSGVIASVRAEARGRTVGPTVVMTPWEGRWSNYAEVDGLRVPMKGEVAWITPQGLRAYWRGSTVDIRYEPAN